jgi:hypothetical protein
MTKNDKKGPRSGLLAAAEALDAALHTYEGLSDAIGRAPLSSQKALERMAASLKEVADCDERLGARARELIEAITGARERQQAQSEAVAARARELQSRVEIWRGLMQRYEELAHEASKVNAMIRDAVALKTEPEANEPAASTGPRPSAQDALEEAYARLSRLAEGAQDLARAAQAEGFVDVTREADSVRQQLLAARNKLGLLRQRQPDA